MARTIWLLNTMRSPTTIYTFVFSNKYPVIVETNPYRLTQFNMATWFQGTIRRPDNHRQCKFSGNRRFGLLWWAIMVSRHEGDQTFRRAGCESISGDSERPESIKLGTTVKLNIATTSTYPHLRGNSEYENKSGYWSKNQLLRWFSNDE